MLTFDPHGGYYHPDHVAIHRATTAAFFASGVLGAEAPSVSSTPRCFARCFWGLPTRVVAAASSMAWIQTCFRRRRRWSP